MKNAGVFFLFYVKNEQQIAMLMRKKIFELKEKKWK